MSVNAYPGGESPYEGFHELIILHCDQCGCQWDAEDSEVYMDEDGPCLQLSDEDAVCPKCKCKEFDWELIND